jgi:hypothetical protein
MRLVIGARHVQNLIMQRRSRLRVIAGTMMVVASVAVSSFADLRAAATAMDCCLKTAYACGGFSAPDDCCKRMGHTREATAAGTLVTALSVGPAVQAIGPEIVPALDLPSRDLVDAVFKRPHDPPHLHTFSLLI